MKFAGIVCAGLLSVAGTATACNMPRLVAIPPKAEARDQIYLRAALTTYVDAMKVYTACVQQELTTAGGDSAPTIVRAVLAGRKNSADAEVEAVMAQFNASLAGGDTAAGGRARQRN